MSKCAYISWYSWHLDDNKLMQITVTKIVWERRPFEWGIRCRVWVHRNNLLRQKLLKFFSSLYIWVIVNEINFYRNNLGTKTFQMWYRTTYFNVLRFSKTDLHPLSPPPPNSTILGHRTELKIVFSTYYYGPNIGVKVCLGILSNSTQSLYIWHGRSALHSCIQLWKTNENLLQGPGSVLKFTDNSGSRCLKTRFWTSLARKIPLSQNTSILDLSCHVCQSKTKLMFPILNVTSLTWESLCWSIIVNCCIEWSILLREQT